MFDRQKGDILYECDECGEVLETNTGDFEAAKNVLAQNGWRPRKVGDEWEHLCKGCSR